MIASRITDFTIPDITRPRPKRFKKQICALLNFHHFHKRERSYWDSFYDQWKENEELIFAESERLNSTVPELRAEVEEEEKTQELWKGVDQREATLRMRKINSELKKKVKEIQERQDMLFDEHNSKKKANTEAKIRSDDLKKECEELSNEIEKLQIRIEDNPTQLRDQNDNQRRRIKEKEQARRDEESKSQSLAQKKRVLEGLEREIEMCRKMVKECLDEKAKLVKEQADLERIQGEKANTSWNCPVKRERRFNL
jgi:kinetochore protein Nuf2